MYLIRQDNEDKWEGELNTDKEGVEEMNSNSEKTCCYCDKHLHFELDMRKNEAAKRKLEETILDKRESDIKSIPYSISTYFFTLLQKAYTLEYAVEECVKKLDIDARFIALSDKLGDKINKSIFACTVNSLVKNKITEAQVKTVTLFLPPVYEIPKQFDAKILLAKYIEQYYGTKEELRTLQEFFLALNFQHINGDLPLTSFYELVKYSEAKTKDKISDKQRFVNICNYIVYIHALNHYQYCYDLCRLDREIENLLVTKQTEP